MKREKVRRKGRGRESSKTLSFVCMHRFQMNFCVYSKHVVIKVPYHIHHIHHHHVEKVPVYVKEVISHGHGDFGGGDEGFGGGFGGGHGDFGGGGFGGGYGGGFGGGYGGGGGGWH